jgi:serine/threonine protein kinase
MNLIDIAAEAGFTSFSTICIVVQKIDFDLATMLQVNPPLSVDHRQWFARQLRRLKGLHSANMIHRDIKSTSLLVNGDYGLKIGDFGLRSRQRRGHFRVQWQEKQIDARKNMKRNY